uniref:TRP C-terminal domain-containing protein n=1 Tax=Globisporangium ultimum (strain ATCC 200006 / CBS 805.95 / DAOM BR144) TaxID=431595 RepID=K3W6S3_GLOUD
MSQVKTPKLGLFRSIHAQCPTTKLVLSGKILERTIRSNLRVWQARVKLRMNYLTYRNKCLKLYCWVALFLYPTVSKTILMIFNCQEIGDTRYLVVDRRIVCYNSTWAIFGVIAMAGVVVWVVGIPFFFWVLIRLAQDRGVAERLRLLRKPQCRKLRNKWLKEVLQQHAEDGVCVPDMDNIDVQDEELAKYMKRKNLKDSTVEARLGFIYADYSQAYWWFEVVDLSRKLFLSGVIVFVQNGSVEQVLLALSVCLVTMWFLLYFQPYGEYSDNLIASVTQLQLFLTLWLGVMIRLNDMNEESLINKSLLSILLVGTCIAVTFFGIGMILRDGILESRRLFLEDKADRKARIKTEVVERWCKAFNYACYESQMARYGQLSFESFSVPAMLDAFRRLKLANSNGRYPLQSLQDICGLVQEQELAEQQRGFPSMDIRLPNLVEDDEEEDAAEQRLHDELLRGGGNDATPPQT